MRTLLSCLAGVLLLTSCADRDKSGKILDNNTSGTITIAVDESLRPLIDAEVDTFEAIYRNAHINVVYTTEAEAVLAMLQDSARMAIVTRNLLPEEDEYLKKQSLNAKKNKIAKSGIAVIIHRDNPDTLLSLEDFRKILTSTNNLSQINKKYVTSQAVVVFDQPSSSIVRYLRDSVVQFDSLPSYCYAVHGNAQVIDYVSKNKQAIGLIDVNWISDRDDSTANSFLSSVKVVGISREGGEYFQPYQAYIANKSYPLLRDILILSREARMGLGSGFTAFVASEKGQRIVLKSGIVPATMPIRIIQVNTEPIRP